VDGTLTALSLDGNTVVKIFHMGSSAHALAIGDGFVWVGNGSSRTVTPINTSTLEEGRAIRVPVTPDALAEGGGTLWVSHP
jgi:hypothetical protein